MTGLSSSARIICAESLGVNIYDLDTLIAIAHQIDPTRREFFQRVDVPSDDVFRLCGMYPTHIRSLQEAGALLVQVSQDVIDAAYEYDMAARLDKYAKTEIHELGIDIETYSDVDLVESGVYKYTESPNFRVLLFAFSINGGEVAIIDLASGEELPENVRRALTDANVLKTAYNAAFERICLSKYLGLPAHTYLDPAQWGCTMVAAARLGLPLSLAQCSAVLGLQQQKMREGSALIRYFSVPCRPTKANGGRTRNLPQHAPDKWATFKRYCVRDVEVEQGIRKKVTRLEITRTEREIWLLDQRINDRGVLIDKQMAQKASDIDDEYRARLVEEAKQLTGLANPNSVSQLKEFLYKKTGIRFESVDKNAIMDMLPKIKNPDALKMISIRRELGKSSTAKYKAMLNCACSDNRVRGLFQFYGANRTGRFSGRLVQLQNLPQNHIVDLDYARTLLKTGDLDEIELEYGNVPQLLSELIRTTFISKEGTIFHVCDFSAIEARVLAWVAGEEWVLDVFRKGGDIYCSTASQMFGVPVEKHGQNAELRQKGKIATLACGYFGGVGAMKAMGGERMGLSEDEMKNNVERWRKANPHIVRFWHHVEESCRAAVKGESLPIEKGIVFEKRWGGVCMRLPSKREIFYPRMHVDPDTNRLVYEGMNQEKKIWQTIETYSGKLTENCIQSIARDCLVETMLRLEKAGYKIVFHVHDEVIIEAPPSQKLSDIERIFGEPIPWAQGLPLKGAGYSTPYYLKD